MLKRNVVLGSLIAGAFLLPSLASAAVQGVCDSCHTMHNSQGGVHALGGQDTLQAKLLTKGCTGCHASNGLNNGSGLGTDTIGAPQVTATANVNPGGYFASGNTANQHDVTDLYAAGDATFSAANVIPGGTNAAAYVPVTCAQCHTQSGHHKASSSYRMLTGTNASSGKALHDFAPNAAFPGDRSSIKYVAADMNTFCAGCHANFHDPGTAGGQDTGGMSGAWVRHPTNIAMQGLNTGSIVQGVDFSTNDKVVVGDKTATRQVMCLSCHVAHGGPNADLLSFSYTAAGSNHAGDGAADAGCETCHSYGSGM